MTRSTSALKSSFRRMHDIAPDQLLVMHGLFQQFYENADLQTFVRDLSKKHGAVLVHDRDGVLRGFSTVCKVPLWDGEKEAIGIFSGDTILDPQHWGDRALKDGFARYMLKELLTNPLTPLYWLLISKGYKTYLLLANNFDRYYPRHDRDEDPKLKRLCEDYCRKLYPDSFQADGGVLDFGESYQCLRDDVAPITPEMCDASPAIAYFEEKNPDWRRGVELPCIAEVHVGLFYSYFNKQRQKSLRPSAAPVPARATIFPQELPIPRQSGVYLAAPGVPSLDELSRHAVNE